VTAQPSYPTPRAVGALIAPSLQQRDPSGLSLCRNGVRLSLNSRVDPIEASSRHGDAEAESAYVHEAAESSTADPNP